MEDDQSDIIPDSETSDNRDSKSKANDRSSMTSIHDTRRQPVHKHSNKRRECSNSQSNMCKQEDECSKFECYCEAEKESLGCRVKN